MSPAVIEPGTGFMLYSSTRHRKDRPPPYPVAVKPDSNFKEMKDVKYEKQKS